MGCRLDRWIPSFVIQPNLVLTSPPFTPQCCPQKAFGLAGVVKGFGISSLKKYGIVLVLQEGLLDRLAATVSSFVL